MVWEWLASLHPKAIKDKDYIITNGGEINPEGLSSFVVKVDDPDQRNTIRESLGALPGISGVYFMGTCLCRHPGHKECPDVACTHRRNLHKHWLQVSVKSRGIRRVIHAAKKVQGVTGLVERRHIEKVKIDATKK